MTTASLTLVIVMAALVAVGIYLMLERGLTRVILGFLLVGNGVNILIFLMAGAPGLAPIVSDGVDADAISDPLPQAFILTAIVINLGLTAFLLALAYRSWWLANLGERGDLVDDEDADRETAREAAAAVSVSAVDDDAVHELIETSDEHVDARGDVDDTEADARAHQQLVEQLEADDHDGDDLSHTPSPKRGES